MVPSDRRSQATRERLQAAAAEVVRQQGLAAASARTIAAQAETNQGLIFYHFGSVNSLIAQASTRVVDLAVADSNAVLNAAATPSELASAARKVFANQRDSGNVALMAQLMAGAQHDETLAQAARYAMDAWTSSLAPHLERVLQGSLLEGSGDSAGLARALAASFVGIELYGQVDPDGAAAVLDVVQQLGDLADAAPRGPVTVAALRARSWLQQRRSGGRR